ncbi:hypothetical protein RhiXN_07544 [Rhizoctonia solani]|uniref:T6SS Phospholipase effector Tle1-like catalytic domain-containing protein n=1 Tax=Rhizoctonia solani TaxID=456999 RepID=A0A8H8P5K8_9AGAM|nr:uncharacterized protein RhiXN_07544 [Rhizoctonia solani]QRW25595.1 hypothetical protein RhiXN_07544 [Rhizoctonia solani]
MSQPVESTRDPGLKPKPRKLIVCIDGTSNQFSEKNTNVVELYSRITKDSTQLTYYNSGVGTYARPFWWSFAYLKQQISGIIDLMIAWNFDQVIIGAYRWLADHYQPGDQIFLFGFSRGAYQVRTLAGMIHTVGLIYPGNQEQIAFAWAIYSGDEPESVKNKFKEAFCREKVDLHFVGVWDTVASVGILPRKPFPFSDKCEHINHFRHALALDERRVKFLPEHVVSEGVQGYQTQEEVWFAGTHSDIGGGNKANPTLDRGGEPLKWMMEEAYKQGLSVRLHDVKIGVPHAEVTDSLRANSVRGCLYTILEILPFLFWKESFSSKKYTLKWDPHLGSPREVLPHQSIHWTVNASLGKNNPQELDPTGRGYSPKAILLDGDLTEEEQGSNVKKIIKWEDFNIEEDRFGRRSWVDDHQFMLMMRILKPKSGDDWFANLKDYVLGENPGKPDAIWAYGGPQFLQKLFEAHQDQESTVKIARLIIGFDDDLASSSPAGAPKQPVGKDQRKREQDLANRLRDMVIPRAILLLREWSEKDVKTTDELPKQSVWASVRGWFGLSSKDTDEDDSLDAKWDWKRIPKDSRSMDLARVVTDILSDAEKTRFAYVMQSSSEQLARQIMVVIHEMTDRETPIQSAASWENSKAALAEGALNVIVALLSLGNDAPRDVFHFENTAAAIRPLICAKERHLTLSLQAMRTAALLMQDLYCGMDVADSEIIPDLIGMMHDYTTKDDLVKQKLANEASITLVTLTKHSWCCQKISGDSELMDKLLQVLKAKNHVDSILQVFRNVSTDYPEGLSPKHIKGISDQMEKDVDALFALANIASHYTFDVTSWDIFDRNKVATKAMGLLGQQDIQIQAAAQLIRNLVDQESSLTKVSGTPLKTSIVLPQVFLALTASVREPSRSQSAIDELLATIVRFLLLKPNPGNKIPALILEAEIPSLAALAQSGKQPAILAVSAAFAHSESGKERATQYISSLAEMMTLEDQKFLKDSIEVLTLLINEGYSLQGVHAKCVMDAIVVIIKAIYTYQLFAEDAPMSDWEKEKVVFTVFDLFEVLCNDRDNRNHLASTEIFETIILGSGIGYATPTDDHANAMVDRLTQYEDLTNIIEALREKLPPRETEDEITDEVTNDGENLAGVAGDQEELGEVKDYLQDTSEAEDEAEDEAEETSPLLP